MASWKVWQQVPAALAAGFGEVLRKLERIEAGLVPRPEPAFVTLLVLADVPASSGGVERTSEAVSLVLREPDNVEFLRFIVHRPLQNLQALVLCDLQRVSVETILCGTRAASLGSSPVGYFSSAEVGSTLGVRVRLR